MRVWILMFIGILTVLPACGADIFTNPPSETGIRVMMPLHLEIEIRAALGDSLDAPLRNRIDGFDVLDLEKTVQDSTSVAIHRYRYKIVALEAGLLDFPPVPFYVMRKGTSKDTLWSEPFNLEVKTVLQSDNQDLREINAPLPIRLGFWDYVIPLIVLGLVVLLIYRLKKRKKKEEEVEPEPVAVPEPPKDTRPAFVIALEKLEELRSERLPERGQMLEYYFRLTWILRFFLELQYGFNAVEMTTSEISRELYEGMEPRRNEILRLLASSDMIKFAERPASVEQAGETDRWLASYLASFRTALEGGNDA